MNIKASAVNTTHQTERGVQTPRHDVISAYINSATSDYLASQIHELAMNLPGLSLEGQLCSARKIMTDLIEGNAAIGYSFNRIISSDSDALYVEGLPEYSGSYAPLLYRLTTLAIGSLFGQPFQYLQQHGGQLIPVLEPSDDSAENTNSTGAHFGAHTDDAFLNPKYRTKYISLIGELNESNAGTGYASISKILSVLSKKDIETLSKPLYLFKKPISFKGLNERSEWSEPRPILYRLPDGKIAVQCPTYNTKVAASLESEAAQIAFDNFNKRVDEKTEWFVVGPTSYLVFRNDRGLHSRQEIEGRRRVYRTYWHEDLNQMPVSAQLPGNIIDVTGLGVER